MRQKSPPKKVRQSSPMSKFTASKITKNICASKFTASEITLRMAIIGKSKGCVLIQNRSFYNRKGRSQTGKGCLKTAKAVRKQEKECSKTCCIYFKLHIYRTKY